jgi:membrane protease YdiL (CAAX protease family)
MSDTGYRTHAILTAISWMAIWLAVPRPVPLLAFTVGVIGATVIVALGLEAARRLGKGAPLLSGRVPPAAAGRLLLSALALGAILGGVLLFVLIYAARFEPALAARLRARAGAPLWMPFVLALESSILEELFFRLFLMSGLVWLFSRAWRNPPGDHAPNIGMALFLSSFAFAAAHVPAWLAATHANVPLIGGVLALNGLAGLVLGILYWRKGIEAAIFAHFAADVIVQALGPRLL